LKEAQLKGGVNNDREFNQVNWVTYVTNELMIYRTSGRDRVNVQQLTLEGAAWGPPSTHYTQMQGPAILARKYVLLKRMCN